MSFSAGVPFQSRQEKQRLLQKYQKLPKNSKRDGKGRKFGPLKSEYTDKYIRWDLVDGIYKPVISGQARSYTPIVPSGDNYELAMNVNNWNSEAKDQYTRGYDGPPAGKSSNGDEYSSSSSSSAGQMQAVSNSNNYPTNWSPSEYDAEYTRKEAHRTVTAPRSIRGTHYGLTDEHNSQMQAESSSVNYPTNWSPSEYDAEYTRKEAHRTVTAPRPISRTPYVLNDGYNADGTFWNSEYELRCAELRKKQQELLEAGTVAGKASASHTEAPYMYAWGQPKGDSPAPASRPLMTGGDSATTEYEDRYRDVSVEERQLYKGRPNTLDLFIGDNTNTNERHQSMTQLSYPIHDIPASDSAALEAARAAVEGMKPKQFAWTLVDGENVAPPKKAQTSEQLTEYTQNYARPSPTPMPPSAPPADTLALFSPDSSSSPCMTASEYDDQFHGHALPASEANANPETRSRVAGIASPVKGASPFAWALMDKEADASIKAPPMKSPYKFPSDLASEYSAKYKEFSIAHRPDQAPDRTSSLQTLLYMDTNDKADPMISQYDLECARLRQKQQSISSDLVAGVKSATRDAAPTYYVWEEVLSAPRPAPVAADPNMKTAMSEYDANFVPLSGDDRTYACAGPVDRTSLNIFSDATNGHMSEYDDAFKQQTTDAVESPTLKTALQHTTNYEATTLDTPLHFAWPAYEQKPCVEKKEKGEGEDSSPGLADQISDYKSNFKGSTYDELEAARGKVNEALRTRPPPMALYYDEKPDVNSPSEESKGCSPAKDKAVVAGLVAQRDAPGIPNYFTWKEAKPTKSEPVPVMRLKAAVGPHTEYDDQYGPVPQHLSPSHMPTVDRTSLNLFADAYKEAAPVTEYDSKFVSSGAGVMGAKVEKKDDCDSPRPLQFAWPLLSPNSADVESVTPKSKAPEPDALRSEQKKKYTWPVATEPFVRVREAPSRQVTHLGIDPDETSKMATHWQSEYKQHSASCPAGLSPAALEKRKETTPTFYAWQPGHIYEEVVPSAASSSARPSLGTPPKDTEYTSKFVNWPVQPPIPSGDRSTLGKVALGGRGPYSTMLNAVTEYDDRFKGAPSGPEYSHPTASLSASQYPSQTLRCTNMEKTVGSSYNEASEEKKSQSPSKSPASKGHRTDYEINYQWPETSTVPKTKNLYSTHTRSKVPIAFSAPSRATASSSKSIGSMGGGSMLGDTVFSIDSLAPESVDLPMSNVALPSQSNSASSSSASSAASSSSSSSSDASSYGNSHASSAATNRALPSSSSAGASSGSIRSADHSQRGSEASASGPSYGPHGPRSIGTSSRGSTFIDDYLADFPTSVSTPPTRRSQSTPHFRSRPQSATTLRDATSLYRGALGASSPDSKPAAGMRSTALVARTSSAGSIYSGHSSTGPGPMDRSLSLTLRTSPTGSTRGMQVRANTDPVLLNKRFPGYTSKGVMASRWSTEARDSFKWKGTA